MKGSTEMSTTMKKTTERLSWNTLLIMYSEYLAVNAEDAKSKLFAYLDESIKQDADELHAGNTIIVLKAVKNNCVDDKKSRFKHASYISFAEKKLALLAAVTEYITAKLPAKSTSPTDIPHQHGKARWELTIEEIDALDAKDYKALDSVYQCMASKKAKYPEAIVSSIGMNEFTKRFQHISAIRSAAKNADKMPKPVVSEDLMTKILEGKTKLTKADIEELQKLLK